MCIITGQVQDVSNTKIFISKVLPAKLVKQDGKITKKVGDKPLQLVIYTNQVYTNQSAAMILPVPLIAGKPNRVRLISFQNYPNIFDDLELLFPMDMNIDSNPHNFKDLTNENMEESEIETKYIGNYKAVIVPNIDQFTNIKYQNLNISNEVMNLLQTYYKRNFAFIVCQLLPTAKIAQYNPIGYVHELREDGRLFVPTRHFYKTRTNVSYSKYYNPAEPSITDLRKAEQMDDDDLNGFIYNTLTTEDRWINMNSKRRDLNSCREKVEIGWDHEIYICNASRITQNALFKSSGARAIQAEPEKVESFYNYIEVARIPYEIAIPAPVSLCKLAVNSIYKYNFDLYL